ncbi:MAG: hypothetical protein KAI55_01520 [Candidatus Aenigmarchaeota archaeon]|nr:hypothetical protein [Candidatus Aenigmarchaeota archaeon]
MKKIIPITILILMVFIGGCTTDSAKIYDIPQNNDNQSPEDNIETTENSCKGITCDTNKKCVDGNCVLKTCGEMKGIICSENKECSSAEVTASDSSTCCKYSCNDIDLCKDVTCDTNKKCVDGNCVLKTCGEMNGIICSENKECSSAEVTASDSSKCCKYSCNDIDLCKGITCDTNKKCVGGNCIFKTCGEMNGQVCGTGTACYSSTVNSFDESECCLWNCGSVDPCLNIVCDYYTKCVEGVCVLKTCGEMNGQVCGIGTACYGSPVNTYDESECCLGDCGTLDPCLGVVCDAGERCLEGECVLATCSYIGGETCDSNSFCDTGSCTEIESSFADYTTVSDTGYCCDGFDLRCVKGDIYLSELLEIQVYSEIYTYFKFQSHNSFVSVASSEARSVSNLDYKLYIDGQLVKSGTMVNYNGNTPFIDRGDAVSKAYVCDGCIDDIRGKTYRIEIDPENKLIEEDENNNVLEGIVPLE